MVDRLKEKEKNLKESKIRESVLSEKERTVDHTTQKQKVTQYHQNRSFLSSNSPNPLHGGAVSPCRIKKRISTPLLGTIIAPDIFKPKTGPISSTASDIDQRQLATGLMSKRASSTRNFQRLSSPLSGDMNSNTPFVLPDAHPGTFILWNVIFQCVMQMSTSSCDRIQVSMRCPCPHRRF